MYSKNASAYSNLIFGDIGGAGGGEEGYLEDCEYLLKNPGWRIHRRVFTR